jgi:hypothetical protein
MSSSSQPLTSTLAELYDLFKDIGDSADILNGDQTIETSVSETGESIEGRYKYEVHDKTGLVYDSGDWQPNLILNCGLDKLAEMPLAQVFQFAVAGKDPTPTKESFEQSNLTVNLLSSSKCPDLKWTGNECDPRRPDGSLIARACKGNLRIADDHALGGTCEQKAFGPHSDLGKLLYLRDMDLQYNVVSSCPVYTEDPVMPEIGILADCSTSLSAAQIPGGAPTKPIVAGTGVWVGTAGAGYMASLSHDTGGPWNIPGNLILKRQNFDFPSGDCKTPLLCTYAVSANHTPNEDEWDAIKGGKYVNTGVGVSIGLPNMLRPDIVAVPTSCNLEDVDITINDPGKGLPIYDAGNPSCKALEVDFNPSSNGAACRLGDTVGSPGKNQPNFGKQSQDPDWTYGDSNMFNITRIGSQQIGKFTDPAIVSNLPASLRANNCTSFQEFFSKIIIFYLFRKDADIAWCSSGLGSTVCQREYDKLSINYSQYEGQIPGFSSVPNPPPTPGSLALNQSLNSFYGRDTGSDWYSAAHRGASDDATNANQDFRPQHYLPWWAENGIMTMDTAGGGGSGYVNLFGGTFGGAFGSFKTSILDKEGPVISRRGGFVAAAGRGNQFSGIPIGALKDLPDYTYTDVDDIIDLGCGITSVTHNSWGGMICCQGSQGNPAFDSTITMNNRSDSIQIPHTRSQCVRPWIEYTITNGKVTGITFKWSELYNMIADTTTPIPPTPTTSADTGQHRHIQNDMNDNTLILGLNLGFPTIVYDNVRGAKGTATIDPGTGGITSITITDGGVGYCPGDTSIRGTLDLPAPRQATLSATTTDNGKIANIFIIDPGAGYSSIEPAMICFPPPPEPDIISYDLVLDPVNTYDSINQGHWHDNVKLPTTQCFKADIFSTHQTDLFDQYKTHGWYVTGNNIGTNTTHCGTDFLSAANQVAMTRTFDFYMELQPVTYAEIGFKDTPAACELWSRIALDPPIKLCPGQFLRLAYQLVTTFEPGPVPRYKEVPAGRHWYNRIDKTGHYFLTGYECIQGLGISVVDQLGIAVPYDITGFANEPYAPGSTNLGPQYGFVNRWYNGDLRLSWPTKEYATDADNPWIHGGDQVNPPDWAIKFKDSSTVNYMPRDFKSYVEDPAHMSKIPNASNSSSTMSWIPISVPAGPELTLERDAFDHWFTKAPPNAEKSITFTNFAANGLGGTGRWDFLVTKDYIADIYPDLLNKPWVHHSVRDTKWIDKYREGQLLPDGSPLARSTPGVFQGPVITYTGQPGALHDPVSVKSNRLTRNVAEIIYPYCDRYHIMFLEPNNTALDLWQEIEWEIQYCKDKKKKWKSPEWCPTDYAPYASNVIDRTWGLTQRKNYYGFGSLINKLPVNEKAGGGFTQIESWMPWTHTPLITSIEQWSLQGPGRGILKPDTAGNWSKAECIPVAGASGFVSTIGDDFADYGNWVNRSHTILGAVSGAGNRPEHDYTRGVSVEVPTYLEPYTFSDVIAGDHNVKKHAIFETSFANLTGIKCIGLGPTSTTLDPPNMTDAPRFNTYVFKFGDVNTDIDYKGMDKLIAYKLDVTFNQTFYRNLKT